MATSYQYDPSLDAQARAVWRGLVYAQGAAQTNQTRALEDYGIGTAGAQQAYNQNAAQLGWNQQDAATSYQRTLADIAQGRTRTGEDYSRNIAGLQRSYQQLRNRQTQQARAGGVLQGGAVLAAARKRAANQAWDRQPIDTSYQRAMQDYGTSETRAGEDYNTQQARLAQQGGWLQSGLNDQLGQLGLTLTRQQSDIGTQLAQQQNEAQQFGVDNAALIDYYKQLAGY